MIFCKFCLGVAALLLLTGAGTTDRINQLIDAGDLEGAYAVAAKAAKNDDPEGDQALGWFYEQGRVVIQSDKKAAEHYRECAKAGLKHCQWRLGVMLDMGQGVDMDPKEAYKWIAKSAEQNYATALVSMGVMHATGRGTPVDYGKSMEFYQRGARGGNPHGFFGIGVLHNVGQGVPVDKKRALAFFLISRSLGDSQAEGAVEELSIGLSQAELKQVSDMATKIAAEYGVDDANGAAASPSI